VTDPVNPRSTPLRGHPLTRELLRDAIVGATSQVASSLTLIAAVACTCFAILVTTGQTAADEATLVAHIDSLGTRLITLSDSGGDSHISPQAASILSDRSDVTWVLGFGPAADVTNPALPMGRAPARLFVGSIPPDVTLIQGRLPQPGEAIAGRSAAPVLNLGPGLGNVTQVANTHAGRIPVVGVIEATGPLEFLNDAVLIAANADEVSDVRYLYIMASDVTVVSALQASLRDSPPAEHGSAVSVEAPSGAISLREMMTGHLGASARQLMAVVMGVMALVVCATVLSSAMSHRRDFGRRRALGASRSSLVIGVLTQVAIVTIGAAALGTAVGLITVHAMTGSAPTWRFSCGVAGLTTVLALASTLPIAVFAATRDPLRILRVP